MVFASVAVALTSDFIAPYPPRSFHTLFEGENGEPPSMRHPLGTSRAGIDVFSEVLHSTRNDLYVGVVATLIAAGIGVGVGGFAGYFGGRAGDAFLGLTQVFLVLPILLLILLFARVFSVLVAAGYGLSLIVLILGFFGWPPIAYVIRGEILRVKELEFIQAERALGAGSGRILFRHILPNVLTPVIVFGTLTIAGFIVTEVIISFLGFGDANTSTWGLLIEEGHTDLRAHPWVSIFPGVATAIVVLAFNLLGDGLSDAFNPRLRE